MKEKSTRQSYGEALVELANDMSNLIVFDADLSRSTRTSFFAKAYPERFFNMGIAEANMIGVAAGLAACGKVVVVSSFAVFVSGRSWDQIRVSLGYTKSNVKICATHSGIGVGEDGPTHHSISDISLMKNLYLI